MLKCHIHHSSTLRAQKPDSFTFSGALWPDFPPHIAIGGRKNTTGYRKNPPSNFRWALTFWTKCLFNCWPKFWHSYFTDFAFVAELFGWASRKFVCRELATLVTTGWGPEESGSSHTIGLDPGSNSDATHIQFDWLFHYCHLLILTPFIFAPLAEKDHQIQ
jgi:hypothetical protein